MKRQSISSEDIWNTLDDMEKEAEKNFEEAKRKLHWSRNNVAGANTALYSCECDANRARMRLQSIQDLKREKDV